MSLYKEIEISLVALIPVLAIFPFSKVETYWHRIIRKWNILLCQNVHLIPQKRQKKLKQSRGQAKGDYGTKPKIAQVHWPNSSKHQANTHSSLRWQTRHICSTYIYSSKKAPTYTLPKYICITLRSTNKTPLVTYAYKIHFFKPHMHADTCVEGFNAKQTQHSYKTLYLYPSINRPRLNVNHEEGSRVLRRLWLMIGICRIPIGAYYGTLYRRIWLYCLLSLHT